MLFFVPDELESLAVSPADVIDVASALATDVTPSLLHSFVFFPFVSHIYHLDYLAISESGLGHPFR